MRRLAWAFAAGLVVGCGGGDDTAATGEAASTSASSATASSTTSSSSTGMPGPKSVSFPSGFLWGAATAGFQVEGGLDATDWGAWARTAGKISNDDDPDQGPDAFAHADDDLDNLVAVGMRAYRFSLELSRVYPTREAFDADTPDADGLAKYDALFDALDARGITPLVTLHHFVWPDWMADPAQKNDPQGWERDDAVDVFTSWCERMGTRYGDRVDMWVTINEPNVEASVGYLAGLWPPGVSDTDRLATVLKAQVRAHAACYDKLHEVDGAAQVSIAQHNRVYEPIAGDDASAKAAKHSDYFWNTWILDAIVKGTVDDDFDGTPDGPPDPTLVGRADYLGINYYGVSLINANGLSLPFVGVIPQQLDIADGRPKTDLGWSIYAQGFGQVLDEAAAYGLPIYVTENGIADQGDVNRTRFTAEHVFELGASIARGDDIRGYFHWALMDNFEWASGYCPRFGLYAVDYGDPARPRSPTKAVSFLHDLIAAGKLDASTIDALPAYVDTGEPCSSF